MKNLDLIPATQAVKDDMRLFSDKLRAYAGIQVDVLSVESDVIRVRVEQKELKNNLLLSQVELMRRARTVFDPLGHTHRLHFQALTYTPELSHVDKEWINANMEQFKLSRKDLEKQLEIDKGTLSMLLTGKRELTKFQKAAFFYYFMTYQLNRDVREFMESND